MEMMITPYNSNFWCIHIYIPSFYIVSACINHDHPWSSWSKESTLVSSRYLFVSGCWFVCTKLGGLARGMSGQGGAATSCWRSCEYNNCRPYFLIFLFGLGLILAVVFGLTPVNSYPSGFLGFRLVQFVRSQSENNPVMWGSDFLWVSALGMNQNWLFCPHSPNWMKDKIGRKPKFAYI